MNPVIGPVLTPQRSERWVMYRIICPIVDASCEVSGLHPYFEYSQSNGPNSNIKADIALLDGETPVWFLEAKKFSRSIHADMVEPYLGPETMGVVSNGNRWVFVVNGRTASVGPLLDERGKVDGQTVNKVIKILKCRTSSAVSQSGLMWDSERQFVRPRGPRIQIRSGGRGTRKYKKKETFDNVEHAVAKALQYAKPNSATAEYLNAIRHNSWALSQGHIEVSKNRFIWWGAGAHRHARINLKSKQLDILVQSQILDLIGRQHITARQKIHDKNPSMVQCFASESADALSLVGVFDPRVELSRR